MNVLLYSIRKCLLLCKHLVLKAIIKTMEVCQVLSNGRGGQTAFLAQIEGESAVARTGLSWTIQSM